MEKSNKKILMRMGIVILIVIIYVILNMHVYIIEGGTYIENSKGFNPTGMQTKYFYEVNFLTNTITRYSGVFSGGIKPLEKTKLSKKYMSIIERIKLRQILGNYKNDKIISPNEELEQLLIF